MIEERLDCMNQSNFEKSRWEKRLDCPYLRRGKNPEVYKNKSEMIKFAFVANNIKIFA